MRWDDLEKSTQARGGIRAQIGLHSAVLAGDERLIDALAEQVLTLTNDYETDYRASPQYYYEACATGSLLLGNDQTAMEYREASLEAVDVDSRSDGLTQAQEGIADHDQMRVTTGIQQIIDYHESVYEEMRPWNQLVSRPGASHLLIARDRDLDVRIDSEYLPPGLGEYGIDEQIDLPVPEYLDDELRVE
jgi:hypothetical protein